VRVMRSVLLTGLVVVVQLLVPQGSLAVERDHRAVPLKAATKDCAFTSDLTITMTGTGEKRGFDPKTRKLTENPVVKKVNCISGLGAAPVELHSKRRLMEPRPFYLRLLLFTKVTQIQTSTRRLHMSVDIRPLLVSQ
jgi:hypothetical protein